MIHCLYYWSSTVSLKVRQFKSFSLFFFKIVEAILGPLVFHLKLESTFQKSLMEFNKICVESINQFREDIE